MLNYDYMELGIKNSVGPRRIGVLMHRSAKFSDDIGELKNLSLESFYNRIKNIPYERDDNIFGEGVQLVARPKYLLGAKLLDCKKKAIFIAAWCNAQTPKVKYKFIATSERIDKELHHVFNILYYKGYWIIVDSTLSRYSLGKSKPKITRFIRI